MKLVIDTNAIISALIKDGLSRKVITSFYFEFITPSFSLSEILKYEEEICKKAGINNIEFSHLLERIFRHIQVIPSNFYEKNLNTCKDLIEDIKDVPFLALAYTFNCPIWSDDKHFKKQKRIKVLTTKDILKIIE